MSLFKKIISGFSILLAYCFFIVNYFIVQAGLKGQPLYLSLDEFAMYSNFSYPIMIFGMLIILFDIHNRFESVDKKVKWCLLISFLSFIFLPYYFLKYIVMDKTE